MPHWLGYTLATITLGMMVANLWRLGAAAREIVEKRYADRV